MKVLLILILIVVLLFIIGIIFLVRLVDTAAYENDYDLFTGGKNGN